MSRPAKTTAEAREQLLELGGVLSTAYMLLKPYEPLIRQFQREKEHMASVGPIIDPTLFMNPERRAAEAVLAPLYDEAARFIETYEAQRDRSLKALRGVQGEAPR